ncbi:histone deacetylase 4-like isoform X1 [Panonychus citri]|uniref:histone deacetylase 4-like isoform X1 n=1 Tax=Panonychus citri TaxID=50023 RepID=UPI002307C46E|nr:histone deacetylase 4-like isoform X1 [Panonychus citri]
MFIKEKHKHSAIASSEVKQRLQEFVLNKQREANQQKPQSNQLPPQQQPQPQQPPPTSQSPQQQHQQQLPTQVSTLAQHHHHLQHHHHHQPQQPHRNATGSVCNSITGTINNGQPPGTCKSSITNNSNQFVHLAWNPVSGKYEENLSTLRKTASEPNLKVRSALKQKVIERRSNQSPLLKRKLPKNRGRHGPISTGSSSLVHQHSLYGSITEGSASAPVSASSSMIQENSPPTSPYGSSSIKPLDSDNSGNLLSHSSHPDDCHITNFITGNHIDRGGGGSGNGSPPLHSSSLHHSGAILSHSYVHPHPHPATTHHVASIDGSIGHPTIIKSNHRRLGRTHSAPLPLGHLKLHSASSSPVSSLTTCTTSSSPSDHQSSTPQQVTPSSSSQHHRNLVKQHIRQTVLTRASSKQQLQSQSFEEETEAAIAQDDMVDSPLGAMGVTSSSSGVGTMGSAASTPPLTGSISNLPGGSSIPSRKERIKRQYSQEAPPTPEEGTSSCSISGIESSYSIDYLASGSGSGSVGSASSGCKSREATPTELGGIVRTGSGGNGNTSGGEPIMMKQSSHEREAFLAQQRDLISPQLQMPPIQDPALYEQIIYQLQQQLILFQGQQHSQPSPPNHQSSSSLHHSNSSVITSHPHHPSHGHPLPPPPPPPPPSTVVTHHHPHHPLHTISLLPEGNQYPQILSHSRYPYYDSTRPLSRASSSPFVALKSSSLEKSSSLSPPINSRKSTTGLAYDNLMLKHQCCCGDNSFHPEHSGRLQSIWARLQETGLASRCEKIRSRKASLEDVQLCHSEAYSLLFGTSPLNRPKLDAAKLAELPIKSFVMLACGGIGVDSDTTWNELHTASAALMAVGCVCELALKVAQGELKNGFAIVRPPGHHAEVNQAMGFCFFNSLAIAAQMIRKKHNMETILIVDWDVHHGNGIQQIFYDSSHVLYISLHRHDDGNFFPGTGDPTEIGIEDGTGFNVNIAWSGGISPETKGDAEYLAAFRSIVLPIAKDFDPEIILVACGFDAAAGHPPPLGGYQVSPACFGWMTKQLMKLANGKLVLALEGGYDLPSICDCAQESVMALLGDETTPINDQELNRQPSQQAIDTLKKVINIQAAHWPVVKRYAHLIECSHLEAQEADNDEFGAPASALASLTMKHLNSQPSSEEPMDQDVDK